MKSLRQVNEIVQRLFPPCLAGSWDNVGLLWEPGHQRNADNVMLCIDLTNRVATEALNNAQVGHIVTYHPPIFRGLKRVTQDDAQQRMLMRLASAGVGIVCVHTSADAIPGGVNDWLAHVVAGKDFTPGEKGTLQTRCLEKADTSSLSESFNGAGPGRLLTLHTGAETSENKSTSLVDIYERLKKGLGVQHLQICPGKIARSNPVHTVAICAGSGGSLFESSKAFKDAEVLLTGELSHHEVLRYQELGKSVILTGHSNSERGYLKYMATMLQKEGLDTVLSKEDADPLETI